LIAPRICGCRASRRCLVTGLDPRDRDRALLTVFERLDLADEARWLSERIRRLT